MIEEANQNSRLVQPEIAKQVSQKNYSALNSEVKLLS